MKILSNYLKRVINEKGNYEITFEVSDHLSKAQVEELEKSLYKVEITKPKSKRSLKQNKYLWGMIKDLSDYTKEETLSIYIKALEEAQALYVELIGIPDVEEILRKNYRAVKIVRAFKQNGKTFYVYKCFVGSSKFDTKEMTKLIDIVKNWCIEEKIPVKEELYM